MDEEYEVTEEELSFKKNKNIEMLMWRIDNDEKLLEDLEPGSVERSRVVSDITKMHDMVCTHWEKEYDEKLKYEEIRLKYRNETIKTAATVVTAGTGVAGLVLWWRAFKNTLHFEQTGSIMTSAGKGVLNIMNHLPGIKF